MKRRKILIANRGEIALRILRSVRSSGFSPVAIFSEADRGAMHVRLADEAYPVGAAPASESYLNIERIVETARAAEAFAIHPGYGFLSENARFARAVEKAGLTWIGPPSKAIAAMGDKIEARTRARREGLPLLPASPPLPTLATARKAARTIGYPVLLKARAGGGGKGMRRVHAEREMESAYALAQSEAKKAFGDETLYLEKFLEHPRHIEVQVFADAKGHVIALGDRECSIQRRHQKIIEESPAYRLSEKTRAAMAEAACRITRSVRYLGAGTIEFLVDAKEHFYFLEMNTRLQVEHPVTEWVTGLDLVAWQINVALGRPLPLLRAPSFQGHAIEVRLYAEDPEHHFFPSPGSLHDLRWPGGPGIRIDSGVESGSEIPIYYDPLIAKISVWGHDRSVALQRMRQALSETTAEGVKTNLTFLQSILNHPKFERGRYSTAFIAEEGPFPSPRPTSIELDALLASAALLRTSRPTARMEVADSLWWRSGLPTEEKEVSA